jgi:uncharacterized membrane protein YjgN (DUF898 family)
MNTSQYINLKFSGEASKLFVILLVNFFFTIITLGLYYPWAKAKLLQYFYSETEFHGSRFVFHGTGKEMFRGYIKVFILFIMLFGSMKVFELLGEPTLLLIATIIFYLAFLSLIPLAIHGVMRYRLSRTSWRGIHFGYRGNLKELYIIYLKGILAAIFTFGICYPWLTVSLRKYVLSHTRFGNIEFKFVGDASKLLGLHLKGIILSIFTLYIYIPWYLISIKNFELNNIKVLQNGQSFPIQSTMRGGSFFGLNATNFFMIIFTLGLGMPFVIIRNMKYHLSNIHFSNMIDMDAIVQTEADYKDATGEDLSDALDLNFF